MKKTNNILITGGAGYIGSHITEKLVKTKSNIIILDNLVTGYRKLINKKAKFVKGDIKNMPQPKKVQRTVSEHDSGISSMQMSSDATGKFR